LDVAVSVPICALGAARPSDQTGVHPLESVAMVREVAVYEAVTGVPLPLPLTMLRANVPEAVVPVAVPATVGQLRLASVALEDNMMLPDAS
jgi:hypothetical protein